MPPDKMFSVVLDSFQSYTSKSASIHTRAVMPAAMAGVARKLRCSRQKFIMSEVQGQGRFQISPLLTEHIRQSR